MNAAVLIVALSGNAMAWNHTGTVWNRDFMPLQWYTGEIIEDSLDEDYQIEVLVDSWDHWVEDAPCASLTHEYMGLRSSYTRSYDISDEVITFQYDDPSDTRDAGVLGTTYCNGAGGYAFTLKGEVYYYNTDCDIVFNDDVSWGTTPDIAGGECSGATYSIEEVATHEIGHLWGMGHTCEKDEVCTRPEDLGAVMFWSGSPCSVDLTHLTNDDVEGITFLYGPAATMDVDDSLYDRYGGVPLEVCFFLEANDTIGTVEWSFGDGETTTSTGDQEVCHTYTEKGQYTVSVTITGESEVCGGWAYTDRRNAFVLACESPEPAEGFDALFGAEHYDGTTYQMVNQADTTVYGCIDAVRWDVYKGDSLEQSINAWSPKIDFGSAGKYRIELVLGGPGGETIDEMTLDVEDKPGDIGGACSTGGSSSGLGLAGVLAALGMAVGRRRRED